MPAIIGFDNCKAALNALIQEARADLAAKKDGAADAYDAAVTRWQHSFFEFVHDSRPGPGEAEAIHELDEQAIRMGEEIRNAQQSQIIARIDARSHELQEAGILIGKQALSNVEAAKRGRLLPIKNAIDSVTSVVNQLKVLKKDLKSDDLDEQKILAEIETLIDRFHSVKATIDAL